MATMIKIPHIHQASYKYLCTFFEANDYEVTEKIDGSNISFGYKPQPFIQTKKSKPIFDNQYLDELSSRFPSTKSFHESAKRVLNDVSNSSQRVFLLSYAKQLASKYNVKGEPFIQVYCEMVYENKSNVIEYNKSNILIILRAVLTNSTNIVTLNELELMQIQNNLNLESWEIINRNFINLDLTTSYKKFNSFKKSFNNKIISRKRDDRSKKEKKEAQDMLKVLIADIKEHLLQQVSAIPSYIGTEIEGVVIRNRDNNSLIKVVDLNDFGKRRSEEWAGIDRLKDMRKQLYQDILFIMNYPDILIVKDKQVQRINEDNDPDVINVILNDLEISNIDSIIDDIINTIKQYQEDIKKLDNVKDIQTELTYMQTYIDRLTTNYPRMRERALVEFMIGPKRLFELNCIINKSI